MRDRGGLPGPGPVGAWAGEDGPSQCPGEAVERRRVEAPGAHENHPASPLQPLGHPLDLIRLAGLHGQELRMPGPPVVPPRGERSGVAHEGVCEGQVEVHRAWSETGGRKHRSGGEGAPAVQLRLVGHARIGEPADRVPEEVRLVDGLGRADVVQFRRAIGRAQDHRDVGQVGLDDRRVQLGRGRPARREDHGRRIGEPAPEGHEARRALVVVDRHLDAIVRRERDGHRRRPAPGAHDRPADPAPHPLVHQRGAAGGGDGLLGRLGHGGPAYG